MADKIRIGMIGAGPWAGRAHLPALALLPEFELKAVATTRQETADAAKAKYGFELAFGDYREMVRHPEVDLVVVAVKVPHHYELSKAALEAGKQVYCEWPLGANLPEAEELTALAGSKNLRTIIGLQGRQDPGANYIRDLIAQGYIGELLTASVTLFRGGALARPASRMWQREKVMGASTLTIMTGHTIDTFRYSVNDDFAEISGRLVTRVPQWRATDTGEVMDVETPDSVLLHGLLRSGATFSVNVTSVPEDGMGGRMELFGREGTIVATFPEGPNIGPVQVMGRQGKGDLVDLPAPDRYAWVPEGMPQGSPFNVAQTYSLFAQSLEGGPQAAPSFETALDLHRVIDVIERSAAEGRGLALS